MTTATTITTNTVAFENEILINPLGFREYDARWEFGKTLNLRGLQQLGLGLGTQLGMRYPDVAPKIVVGHDYRAYSQQVKMALVTGLMQAGCQVVDIGLALSPTAYFAQEQAGAEGVAMVTASHNPNGWTGVKMGLQAKLTHGPQEMRELKDIVLNQKFVANGGGSYTFRPELAEAYKNHHIQSARLSKPLKVAIGCGNGTAAAFAPEVIKGIGCDTIERHCVPDYTFPHFNPNPESSAFMGDLISSVTENGADIGIAFDGDGDRIGYVTPSGSIVPADKAGLILARHLARQHPGSTFVVDVKSTGLYQVDEVLKEHNCTVDYWITGHSYIKRRVKELNARAGFEKSGHFFINEPAGPLYDDALAAALFMLQVIDETGKGLDELLAELPTTYQTPPYQPSCPDAEKYTVVEQIVKAFETAQADGAKVAEQPIEKLITVNGVRVVLADGTWGLVRASSNLPVLVVLAESPVSGDMRDAMLNELKHRLGQIGSVGEFVEGH